MTDIVTRLRNWREVHLARLHLLLEEAADEMAILRSKNNLLTDLDAGMRDGVVRLQAEVRRLEEVIAAGNRKAIAKCDCPDLDNAAKRDILTDEEREAIAWCVEMAATTATECDEELAALRGLLERTK